MDILEKYIIETFNYFKQEIINLDIFDTETDKNEINQLALSKTATEFDTSKDRIIKLLNLN